MSMGNLDFTVRQRGWESRFLSLVTNEMAKPFDWLASNCTDLMATSVYACYGPTHPILQELKAFKDEDATKQYLRNVGGLSKVLDLYFAEVPVTMAQQADLGIFIGNDGDTNVEVGMVILDGVAIGKSENVKPIYGNYIHRVPVNLLSKVYRV